MTAKIDPTMKGSSFLVLTTLEAQAVVTCGEMLKDRDSKFWDGHQWQMEVRDWHGATVCILNFSGKRYSATRAA